MADRGREYHGCSFFFEKLSEDAWDLLGGVGCNWELNGDGALLYCVEVMIAATMVMIIALFVEPFPYFDEYRGGLEMGWKQVSKLSSHLDLNRLLTACTRAVGTSEWKNVEHFYVTV